MLIPINLQDNKFHLINSLGSWEQVKKVDKQTVYKNILPMLPPHEQAVFKYYEDRAGTPKSVLRVTGKYNPSYRRFTEITLLYRNGLKEVLTKKKNSFMVNGEHHFVSSNYLKYNILMTRCSGVIDALASVALQVGDIGSNAESKRYFGYGCTEINAFLDYYAVKLDRQTNYEEETRYKGIMASRFETTPMVVWDENTNSPMYIRLCGDSWYFCVAIRDIKEYDIHDKHYNWDMTAFGSRIGTQYSNGVHWGQRNLSKEFTESLQYCVYPARNESDLVGMMETSSTLPVKIPIELVVESERWLKTGNTSDRQIVLMWTAYRYDSMLKEYRESSEIAESLSLFGETAASSQPYIIRDNGELVISPMCNIQDTLNTLKSRGSQTSMPSDYFRSVSEHEVFNIKHTPVKIGTATLLTGSHLLVLDKISNKLTSSRFYNEDARVVVAMPPEGLEQIEKILKTPGISRTLVLLFSVKEFKSKGAWDKLIKLLIKEVLFNNEGTHLLFDFTVDNITDIPTGDMYIPGTVVEFISPKSYSLSIDTAIRILNDTTHPSVSNFREQLFYDILRVLLRDFIRGACTGDYDIVTVKYSFVPGERARNNEKNLNKFALSDRTLYAMGMKGIYYFDKTVADKENIQLFARTVNDWFSDSFIRLKDIYPRAFLAEWHEFMKAITAQKKDGTEISRTHISDYLLQNPSVGTQVRIKNIGISPGMEASLKTLEDTLAGYKVKHHLD